MNCSMEPAALSGRVEAAASKSVLHRLLIAAALANAQTVITGCTLSEDVIAAVNCLRALGAQLRQAGEDITVTPIQTPTPHPVLDCGESGSVLRFLLPVAAALSGGRFTGRGSLLERPVAELCQTLTAHGTICADTTLPLDVSGGLAAGEYSLPGNISSQYITGLLLALPLLDGDSRIILSAPLCSRAYIQLTLQTLARFNIAAEQEQHGFFIPGRQTYKTPGIIAAERDWSNSAAFLAAGALRAPVTVTGVDITSAQGDKAILDILERFGAAVDITQQAVTVRPGRLHACDVDVGEALDIAPILAILAAGATGTTRLYNAARLRYKESDRLHSTAALLTALGASVREEPDALCITGQAGLTGGVVDGAGDHRIVMAAAIASVLCRGRVTITGAEAVNKSYPRFFEDFNRLGGKAVCHP